MKRDASYAFFAMLKGFLDDYLPLKRGCSDKTVRSYRQCFKLLNEYFSGLGKRFDTWRFEDFTRDAVRAFLTWLRDEKGNSPATLNLRLATIKSFLRYCSEEDVGVAHVYLGVCAIHSFKDAKPQRVDYFTVAQRKLLFEQPDVSDRMGRRDRFFLMFAYESGCRVQEIIDLTLGSVARDGGDARVAIVGKGGKTRVVPLPEKLVAHLDAYVAEFHPDGLAGTPLFYTVHRSKPTPMSQGTANNILKRHAASALEGDPSFPAGAHMHMLRHSVAMAMHKRRVPLPYIADFLGHSNLETVSVYAHADDETILEAVEAAAIEAGSPASQPKKWKGKELELLRMCGLA